MVPTATLAPIRFAGDEDAKPKSAKVAVEGSSVARKAKRLLVRLSIGISACELCWTAVGAPELSGDAPFGRLSRHPAFPAAKALFGHTREESISASSASIHRQISTRIHIMPAVLHVLVVKVKRLR
jgi:hypothetical protein